MLIITLPSKASITNVWKWSTLLGESFPLRSIGSRPIKYEVVLELELTLTLALALAVEVEVPKKLA